jgi:hypothetical protein
MDISVAWSSKANFPLRAPNFAMSASLIYGLVVDVNALFAAVAMDRLLAKPSLVVKMLMNRRTAATLANNAPGQVSLASLPVEVLSRIHIELGNQVRRSVKDLPAPFLRMLHHPCPFRTPLRRLPTAIRRRQQDAPLRERRPMRMRRAGGNGPSQKVSDRRRAARVLARRA